MFEVKYLVELTVTTEGVSYLITADDGQSRRHVYAGADYTLHTGMQSVTDEIIQDIKDNPIKAADME